MIRIDITDRWEALRSDPSALQRYILDVYGADHIELAAFPNTALHAHDGQLLGYAKTYGYPRVTVEDGRVWLELADLIVPLDAADRGELREQLASLAHEQWSGWWKYAFAKGKLNEDGTLTLPVWAVERWTRQMRTPYAELPDDEKASDRVEADKVLALFDVEGGD